jgi:uncharacterized membrane-anchored protein
MHSAKAIWRDTLVLTVVGGLAFWLANFVISRTHIAAEYRAAMSISYIPMLLESLVGGLAIGLLVSYSLLHFFDRIPGRNAILKAILVSLCALVLVTVLFGRPSSFAATDNVPRYFLIGTMINVIRIPVLGLAVGCACTRRYRPTVHS